MVDDRLAGLCILVHGWYMGAVMVATSSSTFIQKTIKRKWIIWLKLEPFLRQTFCVWCIFTCLNINACFKLHVSYIYKGILKNMHSNFPSVGLSWETKDWKKVLYFTLNAYWIQNSGKMAGRGVTFIWEPSLRLTREQIENDIKKVNLVIYYNQIYWTNFCKKF